MVEVSDSKPEPPAGPTGPIQSVSFTQRKASGVAKRTYGAEDGADSGAGVRSESVRCTKRSLTISSDKFGPFGLAGGLPAELQHVVVAAEWLALFRSSEKDLKEGRMASYLGSASMKDLRNVADSDGLVGAVVHGGLGMARASAATIGLAPAAIASRARLPSRLAPAKEGWAEGDVLSGGDHDVADGGAVRPPASAEP